MRRLLLALAFVASLSGCASETSAPPVLVEATGPPAGPWNFTASDSILLEGLGACGVMAVVVPAGATLLDVQVWTDLFTANGLNNIDGAGRVEVKLLRPDGSEVALEEQTVVTQPTPYAMTASESTPAAGEWRVRVQADPAAVSHRIRIDWAEQGIGPEPTPQQQSGGAGPC
jgi:hypothetical protein